MNLFASAISLIFSPPLLLPVLLLLIFHNDYPNVIQLLGLTILMFFGVIPITIHAIFLKKTNQISDWEMKNRHERRPLYISAIVFGSITSLLLYIFDVTYLANYLVLLSVWFFSMSLINHYWKISGHVGSITMASMILIQKYGIQLWPLFLIIPIVSWSRVHTKNHSLTQVVGAFLLVLLIVVLAKKTGLV